ncbi:flippase [Dehalococcoidia bacterium]|nr:flippase [Dehalococcoidia bacterium]
MSFIKDTLITFSTQIITVILGIAAAIIIARVLGPEGKGAYTLIILVPVLLVSLGNLGIGIANVYLGGSKKYKPTELASNSLIAALGLGVILSVAFLIYYYSFAPSFLQDVDPLSLSLAVIVLPLSLLTMYFSYILLGQNRIKGFNMVHLLQGGALLVLLFFFLLVVKGGIFTAILAWVSATFVATILSILLVRKLTNIRWSFYRSVFKDSVKFGIKGYLGNVIQLLNYRLDMFLVAYFMSATFVGYYSVAVALAEALWYFPAAVGVVIFARTSGLSAEEANRSTPVICRNTLFLTLAAGVLLFFLGKYVISLFFGSAFLPAVQPLWILLPGIVALSICKVLSNEITGRGKPMINTVAAAVSLAVNIPLNLLLIPKMGIAGAALASTVSYTATAVIVLIAFLRISRDSLFDTIIIKPQDLRIYTEVLTKGRRLAFGEGRRLVREALSGLNPRLWGREYPAKQNPPVGNGQDPDEQQERDGKSG